MLVTKWVTNLGLRLKSLYSSLTTGFGRSWTSFLKSFSIPWGDMDIFKLAFHMTWAQNPLWNIIGILQAGLLCPQQQVCHRSPETTRLFLRASSPPQNFHPGETWEQMRNTGSTEAWTNGVHHTGSLLQSTERVMDNIKLLKFGKTPADTCSHGRNLKLMLINFFNMFEFSYLLGS